MTVFFPARFWRRLLRDAEGDPLTPGAALLRFVSVAAGIYLVGWLTNLLTQCGLSLVPCWVASGMCLVALILFGPLAVPAAWLGMFALQMDIRPSWTLALWVSLGKTAASVVGWTLLRRSGFKSSFSSSEDVVRFFLYGAGVAMGLSGGVAALLLLAWGVLPPSSFLAGWWTRWWMDALGLLLMAPPFLLSVRSWWDRNRPEGRTPPWHAPLGSPRELVLALGFLLSASLVALDPFNWIQRPIPDIFLLPFLVWIALRGSTLLASWCSLGVAAVAISREILLARIPEATLVAIHRDETWAFLATVTTLTLLVSSLRHRVLRALVEKQEAEVQRRLNVWSESALQNLPVPILISQGDGSLVFLNEEFTRRFGYSMEKVPTLVQWSERAFPDRVLRGEYLAWREQVVAQGRSSSLSSPPRVWTITDAEGRVREVEARIKVVEDLALCSLLDLTEQLDQLKEITRLNRFLSTLSQVNQSLIRSESREVLFRDICEVAVAHGGFALAWIGWAEVGTRRVVPVAKEGPAVRYLDGIRIEADASLPEGRGPVGLSIREGRTVVCNDIAQDAVMAPWRDRAATHSLRSLMAVPIREGGTVRGCLVVYSRDTEEFQEREVALLEEMAQDISFSLDMMASSDQRRAAEEALQKSEFRLRMALESTGIGLVDWNLTTGTWFATPAYFQMLGEDPQGGDQRLEHWLDRIHPEDRDRVLAHMRPVNAGRQRSFDLKLRMRHRDGSYRWVHNLGHAVEFDEKGRTTRMLGLRIDITDRVTLETQLLQSQKLEAIGQLAGGVAHDFNNILGAITGFVDLAEMELGPEHPARHDLDQALKAAQRGALLTSSLLAFGRKQPMKVEALDLSQVVAHFEKFLRRLIPEDLTLTIRLSPEPLRVMADRVQVEQILMNLVTNARDAMPGGGEILVETSRGSLCPPGREPFLHGQPPICVILSVQDTGSGIPEAIRSKIYEPFFTTKEQGKGTGLGLATVYGIVERHGGFIELDSRAGIGTTFRIHFPMLQEDPDGQEEQDTVETSEVGQTGMILLAEDDEAIRSATATLLRRQGYTVIEAVDGQDAVDHFRDQGAAIDLVILDGIMPRVDGWEAWTAIRHMKPGIRALFISGYSEDVFRQDGAAREGMEILAKPFKTAELLSKVRRALENPGN